MQEKRLRYAPSPSGFQHLGSIKTLLINWLFAKKNKGKLILRIEDTDQKRIVHNAVKQLQEVLDWMGLDIDEGPFYQSDRLDLYQRMAKQLVQEGKAYYCHCSPEMLENARQKQRETGQKIGYNQHCRELNLSHGEIIRIKTPEEGSCDFIDMILGPLSVQNKELDDFVIMRQGRPIYHFAVVVDDHEMGISHVIRGHDLLSSTPRHIHLYQSFNWHVPIYAHLPIIHDEEGKKISKRTGGMDVLSLKDRILPDALLNYIARLGWSCKDQEIFTREELIQAFDMASISKHPVQLNDKKLLWINQMHMIKQGGKLLAKHEKLACIYAKRSQTLVELHQKISYLLTHHEKIVLTHPKEQEVVQKLQVQCQHMPWVLESIRAAIKDSMKDCSSAEKRTLYQKLNQGISGSAQAPDLAQILEALGQEKAVHYFQTHFIFETAYEC